jgi:hypothetical protein
VVVQLLKKVRDLPEELFQREANRPLKKSIFPVFTPKTCSPQQLA